MLLERWLRSQGFTWPTTSGEFVEKVLAWCIEHPEQIVCASSVQVLNVPASIVMQAPTLNECYLVQLYRHDGVQGPLSIVSPLPHKRVNIAVCNLFL